MRTPHAAIALSTCVCMLAAVGCSRDETEASGKPGVTATATQDPAPAKPSPRAEPSPSGASPASAQAKPAAAAEAKPASPAKQSAPAPDADRVRALVAAYEKARLGLALDDIQATRGGAEKLRVTAAGFSATLDGAARNRLTAVAQAAGELGRQADFATARASFGRVSTLIIRLAHAAKLGGEVFVFQCPMVEEGESRWLQATAEMNNPYMGKRMPKCGGRVPLRP